MLPVSLARPLNLVATITAPFTNQPRHLRTSFQTSSTTLPTTLNPSRSALPVAARIHTALSSLRVSKQTKAFFVSHIHEAAALPFILGAGIFTQDPFTIAMTGFVANQVGTVTSFTGAYQIHRQDGLPPKDLVWQVARTGVHSKFADFVLHDLTSVGLATWLSKLKGLEFLVTKFPTAIPAATFVGAAILATGILATLDQLRAKN